MKMKKLLFKDKTKIRLTMEHLNLNQYWHQNMNNRLLIFLNINYLLIKFFS